MNTILVINPGSTSTKLAVYDGEILRFKEAIDHTNDSDLMSSSFAEQVPLRLKLVRDVLACHGVDLSSLAAAVGRGGVLKPLPGGVYRISKQMRQDLLETRYGDHASGIGSILAYDIAVPLGIPAMTVDPVVVSELEWPAQYSGHPDIPRISIFHALNQKAVARRYAAEANRTYGDLNLIVAHLGGGVSIGAHRQGKVIDVANAFDGEGPFSAERTGSLPIGGLIRLCYSGRFKTEREMRSHLIGRGGLFAYLGTKDAREVDRRIESGDEEAKRVLYAMCYQIKKEIGALYVVLEGKVDAILLTGGMSHDPYIVDWIRDGVSFLAPVKVYPGENELEALRDGALAVLNGRETLKEYDA